MVVIQCAGCAAGPLAQDFERERKWRVGQAKRTAGRALRQLQEFVSRHERKEKVGILLGHDRVEELLSCFRYALCGEERRLLYSTAHAYEPSLGQYAAAWFCCFCSRDLKASLNQQSAC